MATKTITAVAIVLGLVAASAGSAGAGAGGGGISGANSELFQCYNINGTIKADVTIVGTNDEFTDPTDVPIPGAPQILCVSASASNVSPQFNTLLVQPDSILCYAPQVSTALPSGVTITVNDPLTPGGTQTVRVSSTKYVCVSAITSDCPLCRPVLPPLQ